MFRYPVNRTPPPEFPNGPVVSRTGSQERLTGYIGDQKASDLEERLATSWNKLKQEFIFRVRISALANGAQYLTSKKTNAPGELEIDFLLPGSQIIPVLVDGEISHFMTPHQRDMNEEKAALIDTFGEHYGWRKVVRVPFVDIQTQYASDNVAKQILEGSYTPRFVT